jgi:hypothetical protein
VVLKYASGPSEAILPISTFDSEPDPRYDGASSNFFVALSLAPHSEIWTRIGEKPPEKAMSVSQVVYQMSLTGLYSPKESSTCDLGLFGPRLRAQERE